MTTGVRRTVGAVVTVALCGLVAACSRQESPQQPPTPLDPATLGTVTGQVRVTGPVPAQTTLTLTGSADCAAQHGGPVLAGDVLVEDGRVANALVYVKEGLGDRVFATPTTPVVIDQEACLFVPRVAAAQVGQPIEFLNSDPLQHNVHGTPAQSRGWNVSLMKGASRTVRVGTPEAVIEIKCDIHPWMRAYLGVFAHPYFAVTGRDGRFTLADLPAGDYVLDVWHERLGTQTGRITLAPQETKDAVFVFALGPPG